MTHRPIRADIMLMSCALFLAAACSERSTGTPMAVAPLTAKNVVARMRCRADVPTGSIDCGLQDSPVAGGTSALTVPHVLGGQGTYVRLTSSGLAYNAGTAIYSFNVTVQNLTSTAMATADGTTRDPAGVVVFFETEPTTTGGTGTMSVANATGQGTFTSTNQSYFQYGGSLGGVDQGELGADGILASGEVSSSKAWQFNMPATVTSFEFYVYVSTETTNPGATASVAPQVTSVSPATLTAGTTATLTGTSFNATPGSNNVLIGGRTATVTGGTSTTLQVTVPCVPSGSTAINVTQGGMRGADFTHPMQVTQRTLGVGDALIMASASDAYCNELPAAGGAARYVVSVFSDNSSPSSNSPFQFSGDAGSVATPLIAHVESGESLPLPAGMPRPTVADARHSALLEQNAQAYTRLHARRPLQFRIARPSQPHFMMTPPSTRTFRISNINATAPSTICNSYYVASATLVYAGSKILIYEDDATPDAVKASLVPAVAAAYTKIGTSFENDVEPMIRTNFGDILRRDAELDADGSMIVLISPRLNTSFSGTAGFSTTCDQFPNDDSSTPAVGGPYTGSAGSTKGASNFGEILYMNEATSTTAGFSGTTLDNWLRTIRTKIVHESKHVASYSARIANNAPGYESTWLEEGTARVAEELWGRIIDAQAWKADIGYGSFANPISVYCDARPGFAECDANARRPAVTVQTHFASLYTELFGTNARLLSPFGATASDNASYFWNVSWSLLRHAADRYASSEGAFFTALNQSTSSGLPNLLSVAGVGVDTLVGRWALALYADNYGGAINANADVQFASWNVRGIYTGLNTDFPSTYTLAYPLVPQARTFGTFAPVGVSTLRGGGLLWYEISGTSALPQLLRLETNGGGAPSANLRLAVMRLQ